MKKYFIGFFILAFVVAVVFKTQAMISTAAVIKTQPVSPTTNQRSNVPYERLFTGTYVCLPHKDTNGPQTLECALGLKADDGSYVAMDLGSTHPLRFVSGDRIKISGMYVPIEQLSSDHWQKYPITGIVQVKEASKL